MPKGPVGTNQSTLNSQLPRKKKYTAPQCNRLTADEAKARLKSANADDPAVKQLLEQIAQLEIRKQGQ